MASITIDTTAARKALGSMARQLDFAASKAMNGVMYEAQKQIRQELGQHFTVRRKTFIEQSIKVKPTHKTKLVGAIGVFPRPNSSIDEALAAQEFGGERPNPNGGRVAVPLAARPTPQSITPPGKWPGKLKNTFTLKGKGNFELLLQRTKKRTHGPVQKGHDPNLKVMYALTPRIQVRKRWNFVATVFEVTRRLLPTRMAQELTNAIRTAR
jgi:hypothetical protein